MEHGYLGWPMVCASWGISNRIRALYHALKESILKDEDSMDKGVADKLKKGKPDDAKQIEGLSCWEDHTVKKEREREDTGKTDETPSVKADPKDWLKKLKRPPTPDPEWNTSKTVDDGPTQNWLSDLTKAEKPSKMFNELMSTPIDFTTFVLNR
ncbi:hypothetical protein Tco_0787824 [Tanacetum coccineum]